MNEVDQKGYIQAMESWDRRHELQKEQRTLEEKQRGYVAIKRAKRLVEIEEELRIVYDRYPAYKPMLMSVVVERWTDAFEEAIKKCDDTIIDFAKGVVVSPSYTLQWRMDDVVRAETLKHEYNYLLAIIVSQPVNELCETLQRFIKTWTERVVRHASRGNSRSTSQQSNLVEAIQVATFANLADRTSFRPIGRMLWDIESVTENNVPVWEDREFEKEDES